MYNKEDSKNYFNKLSTSRIKWKKRNSFYHKMLEKYFNFFIPKNSKVLEIGCGTGELLKQVEPSYGVGIDFSEKMIDIARQNFPKYKFEIDDAENLNLNEKFDYIIASDFLTSLWDV